MDKDTLIYLAGLIDGLGSISITKDYKNNSYYIHFSLSSHDKCVTDLLIEHYGRNSYTIINPTNKNRTPIYSWKICGKNLPNLINDIYPYSRFKKERFDIALQFCNTLNKDRVHIKIPEEIRLVRKKLHEQLCELNQK